MFSCEFCEIPVACNFIKKETLAQAQVCEFYEIPMACNFIKKETLAQAFSCEFYKVPLACNFIKKGFLFLKFLRTPFFIERLGWLLLFFLLLMVTYLRNHFWPFCTILQCVFAYGVVLGSLLLTLNIFHTMF